MAVGLNWPVSMELMVLRETPTSSGQLGLGQLFLGPGLFEPVVQHQPAGALCFAAHYPWDLVEKRRRPLFPII